jgi:hypothetical protein
MSSMLPIIPMSILQRSPKSALDGIQDYAVIQSHGKDKAFVLDPQLGRILLETGMLETLREKRRQERSKHQTPSNQSEEAVEHELKNLIGGVLRELSKK